MVSTNISIRMDAEGHDFDMLTADSMEWCDSSGHNSWRVDHPDRFVPLSHSSAVRWDFRVAYWLETWADLLLTRSFLDSVGAAYQVLADEDEAPTRPRDRGRGRYTPIVLVTNFVAENDIPPTQAGVPAAPAEDVATPHSMHELARGYALAVLDLSGNGLSYGVNDGDDVAEFARQYSDHFRHHPETTPNVSAAFGEWRTTGQIVPTD